MSENNAKNKSRYSDEVINKARLMYVKHHTMDEIRQALSLPNTRVLYRWKEHGKWDELIKHEDLSLATSYRLLTLIDSPKKTSGQLSEIDTLGDLLLKLAKVKDIQKNGQNHQGNRRQSGQKSKKKKRKNDIEHISQESINEVAKNLLFDYQQKWRKIGKDPKIRDRWILKSRQIGATFYFAFEAFERAIITGKNQIFLSASRRQAEVFRAYIIALARNYFGTELTGNPIVLSNGAQCFFLSNNALTAQSECGDTYFDEVMWTSKFDNLYEVASPMSSQKQYTTTCFSTPSTVSHEGYKYFSGEKYNEGRPKKEHIQLDLSHKALKDGRSDADGVWRQIVTIYDAENPKQKRACDLFDVEYLERKYSPSRFDNLFKCKFIDDTHSVFSLKKLLACATDSGLWKGFNKDSPRPWGNRPVLLGYDPSRNRDNAEITAQSDPVDAKDKFRLLERKSFNNTPSDDQVKYMKGWHDYKYNVIHVGVDRTGMGIPIFDKVQDFFPNAMPFNYSPEIKTKLVHKGLDVINSGRFEYDASEIDVPLAFMTIRETVTEKTRQITYISDRTQQTGHGDVAWSLMHGWAKEPLIIERQRKSSVTMSTV